MALKISKQLARQVRERANGHCEYCQTSEWLSGQPNQIDHILPRAKGGQSTLDNLCLACAACNSFKLDLVEAGDPESRQVVRVFHPRQQTWHEHFAWSEDHTQIIGLTACGRATVELLKMNRPLIVAARTLWIVLKKQS
jgi:hypothetical protein